MFFFTHRESGLVLPPSYWHSGTKEIIDPVTFKFISTCPDYDVRSLQRCLLWRMAIDWKLQHHISKYDRPSDVQYSNFEGNCKLFGSSLCTRNDRVGTQDYLSKRLFEPAGSIGISRNLLELFMFSVRQAEQYPLKRIASRRNAMMLVRLVLDSSILIDLMAPNTVFAKKLKAKCADLHQKNFPWLLDPTRISIDESVKARATDIYNDNASRGRWKETELLLRECLRPCAAFMDPELTPSTMCEVNMCYLETGAHVGRLPGFTSQPRREYKNLLPAAVVCGPVEWPNTDLFVAAFKPKDGPRNRRLSKQAIQKTAAAVYRLITTGQTYHLSATSNE